MVGTQPWDHSSTGTTPRDMGTSPSCVPRSRKRLGRIPPTRNVPDRERVHDHKGSTRNRRTHRVRNGPSSRRTGWV